MHFCRCPAPNEPPFVKAGDRVKKGQTVCIIEAMKLMNEIEVRPGYSVENNFVVENRGGGGWGGGGDLHRLDTPNKLAKRAARGSWLGLPRV